MEEEACGEEERFVFQAVDPLTQAAGLSLFFTLDELTQAKADPAV